MSVRRIVCVGDSITYGEFVHSNAAWPTKMRNWVPEWRIHSRGVCGDTTRLALERFPRDVQALRAEIVVIQFGHNDANIWPCDNGLPRVSLDAFVANLQEMSHRAVAAGAKRVLLVPPHRTSPIFETGATVASIDNSYDSRLDNYAAAMRSVSRALGHVYVDTRAREVLERVPQIPLCADGLHLNHYGHERYAWTIGKAIAACLPI